MTARRRTSLRESSRARYSTLYYRGDWEWFGPPNYPDFPESDDDEWIDVTLTTRLDRVANDVYDDPALWFVIALANNLELLPADLYPGQTIRIPPKSTVKEILRKSRRST